MARVALAAFLKCAREMKDQGAFTYVREMAPMKEVRGALAAGQPLSFGQCYGMIDPLLTFIVAVFLLAGFVKGVIGLGLPPVSMGLLAVAMPPAHALAIVIVPGHSDQHLADFRRPPLA